MMDELGIRKSKLLCLQPYRCVPVLIHTNRILAAIRPIMPTAQVCAKFEQLQSAIITLLDLKRQVDRQETDLKVKKAQKTKDGPSTPGPESNANRVSSRAQM